MGNLTEIVESAIRRHPATGRRWLGYSGGLDSTVLLHLLAAASLPVHAVHVNHGLSPWADQWQDRCAAFADRLGIEFTALRVRVDAGRGGLEKAARSARYAAFRQLLQPGDQWLLAHHADDQVETFLLRLLRGAGALGLAGMAESRPLGRGMLLRPLLGADRAALEQYARAHSLDWIEDESNADERLERNYLRARVVPLLRARWPVAQRVARACDNLREAAGLLAEVADGDLSHCGRRAERLGESIELAGLESLSLRRRKNLLRRWLQAAGGDLPEAAHLDQALAQALGAANDRRLAVKLGGLVLRRFRGRVFLTPELSPAEPDREWTWNGEDSLSLPGGWQLVANHSWPAGDYLVRFRRGGERAHPKGRGHSQSLKKLLQEWGLEPWLRDRVPLVFRDDTLLAAGDLFVCEEGFPGALEWRHTGSKGAIGD